MDQIEMLTEQLLQAILASDIYKDYIEQEEKLEHIPGLKERVNRFRADNFPIFIRFRRSWNRDLPSFGKCRRPTRIWKRSWLSTR